MLSEDKEKTPDCSSNDEVPGKASAAHISTRDEVIQATVKELARLKDNGKPDAGMAMYVHKKIACIAPALFDNFPYFPYIQPQFSPPPH